MCIDIHSHSKNEAAAIDAVSRGGGTERANLPFRRRGQELGDASAGMFREQPTTSIRARQRWC